MNELDKKYFLIDYIRGQILMYKILKKEIDIRCSYDNYINNRLLKESDFILNISYKEYKNLLIKVNEKDNNKKEED